VRLPKVFGGRAESWLTQQLYYAHTGGDGNPEKDQPVPEIPA